MDDPSRLPQAKFKFDVPAKQAGYVSKIEADDIGTAAMLLGAGRATKESEIDLAVGLVLHKKVGDQVAEGESLMTIHANTEQVDEVLAKIYAHVHLSAEKVEAPKLIEAVITE